MMESKEKCSDTYNSLVSKSCFYFKFYFKAFGGTFYHILPRWR